jgi:hypothetical protein
MVAKVLAWLGVPMGVPTTEPVVLNYEDPDFVTLLHLTSQGNVDRVRLKELIAARNKVHPVWGFKVPMAIMTIRLLESELRHPYFIFVFRDLLAAALRSKLASEADVLVSLRLYGALYGQIWNFLEHTNSPCMLASYEKAIRNPDLFTGKVAEFTGMDTEKIRLAAAQVQAGHY